MTAKAVQGIEGRSMPTQPSEPRAHRCTGRKMTVNLELARGGATTHPIMEPSPLADLKLTLLGGFEMRLSPICRGRRTALCSPSWPSLPEKRIRANASPVCFGARPATSRRATA
jgi:hypothetical protein